MAAKIIPPTVTREYLGDNNAGANALAIFNSQVWKPKRDTEEARRNCGIWQGRVIIDE